MEICDIKIIEAPDDSNRVRICAQLVYDDDYPDEELWFEFDQAYAHQISDSGNPWLACLLPVAAVIGQPLKISRPVDPLLLQNAKELLRIWDCWYDYAHVIDIEADSQQPLGDDPQHTAALFSGGVDAFFTVLNAEHPKPDEPEYPIDDLINLWGFDIWIDQAEEYRRLLKTLRKSSAGLGKNLIETASNVYNTRYKEAHPPELAHGGVLSSLGLLLEKRFKSLLIPSSSGYKELQPWGSHPLTDPLYSTTRTQIIHHGGAYSRTDKTEFIARSEIAMQNLRVCFRRDQKDNCCTCKKCYRTMITLETLGVLDRTPTFKRDNIPTDEIQRIYSPHNLDVFYMQDNIQLAKKKNRPEMVRAFEQSLKYSESLNRKLAWVDKIPVIVLGAGRRSWKRPAIIRRVVWALHQRLKKWVIRNIQV